MVIDKNKIIRHFRKSTETYDENARIQQEIALHLAGLLKSFVKNPPDCVLEVGCGTGFFTRELIKSHDIKHLYVNDLVNEMCSKTSKLLCIPDSYCLPGDIEVVELPILFDLIASASTFQWLDNPRATFGRLAEQLNKEGRLVFSTFGKENFSELRTVTGSNGMSYRSIEELQEYLAVHFDIRHVEEEKRILYFSDPLEILQHLRNTGVNAVNSGKNWTKSTLERFVSDYKYHFSDAGGYPLTYHPIYFLCQKR